MDRQGMKLTDLVKDVESRQRLTSDVTLPLKEVAFREDGKIEFENLSLGLTPEANHQLANVVKVPLPFINSLNPADKSRVMEMMVNGDYGLAEKKYRFIVHDNQVVAGVTDSNLISLSATEVLETALDSIPAGYRQLDQLEVKRFQHDCVRLRLSITSPVVEREIRPGDLVSAGMDIIHSPTSYVKTQIMTFMFRLICSNGQIVPVCESRLRLRRLEEAGGNRDRMRKKVEEMSSLAWNDLVAKIEALSKLQEVQMSMEEIRGYFEKLAREFHLGKRVVEDLMIAFAGDEIGEDYSLYGVMNSFTRVASHGTCDALVARRLMAIGGMIGQSRVHRCRACNSVVRRVA